MMILITNGFPIYLLMTTLPIFSSNLTRKLLEDMGRFFSSVFIDSIIIIRKKNNANFLALFLYFFYSKRKTAPKAEFQRGDFL
jgi:hypothetical protein